MRSSSCFAIAACVFGTFACSSANFELAASDAGDDASALDAAAEAGSDLGTVDAGPPDPCAPEADKAKFCVEVKLARADHPRYNAASGAETLAIDGKGKVVLALYDKAIAFGPGAVNEPALVVTQPSTGGKELDVDSELPTTIVGTAAPGEFSVVAVFQDNKVRPRTPQQGLFGGDFVALPTVVDAAPRYPKLTLAKGTTARLTLELVPFRQVTLEIGPGASVVSRAKTNTKLAGDGPTLLGLFDGTDKITAKTPWLSLDLGACIDLNLQGTPVSKLVEFGTAVEGSHNMFVALYDYPVDKGAFLGSGTLVSPLAPAPVAGYPRIELAKTSWTASATISLDDVAGLLVPSDTPNPTCP